MIFQAKHYNILAELLEDLPTTIVTSGPGRLPHLSYHTYSLIDSLCDIFEKDNKKFNKHKFIMACGFEEPWDEVIMGHPFTKEEIGGTV